MTLFMILLGFTFSVSLMAAFAQIRIKYNRAENVSAYKCYHCCVTFFVCGAIGFLAFGLIALWIEPNPVSMPLKVLLYAAYGLWAISGCFYIAAKIFALTRSILR